jgi:hypothetical protein
MKRIAKLLRILTKRYPPVHSKHCLQYDEKEQSLVLCIWVNGVLKEFLLEPEELLEVMTVIEEVTTSIEEDLANERKALEEAKPKPKIKRKRE